ncbi:putative Permease of the major facilitator superfamily MFS_1 [metagenome]|uniref:Putative Permease of the major facilitator superfamily MFS_1 n=1 Tax=metagenome TaxID=256318 RepID=A0A2P2CHD6_9ZZZZ
MTHPAVSGETAAAQQHDPQPGALDAAGLRRVVTVLSTVQIVSWGVLYYAFAAVQSSITTDTGWSSVAVTGAFSLAQLCSGGAGIWVGRHIDAYGPRRVMTAASLTAIPGIAAVALAPNLAVFYLGWMLTGVAMAGTLYPPAFAALTHWGGTRRVQALTTLTLVAGLASTVFAPLASVLDDAFGWRAAYLVLLTGLVVVTVPLHWWGLGLPWHVGHAEHAGSEHREHARARVGGVARSAPFVLLTLANALTGLAVFAVVINLVPMLVEQGMSRNLAAVALGLGGVGQVAGRLGYARFAAATSVTTRGVLVLAGVAVSTAALALAPPAPGLLIVLGMLLGLARGVYTLVHATAVTDRWGPASYGTLNGILSAPALVAAAVAPFAGAMLAEMLGSYANAFLVLAGVAGLAAVLMLGATPVDRRRSAFSARRARRGEA